MLRKSFLVPLIAFGLIMPLVRADDKPASSTGTVAGKVVDADGKAVAGATVGVYPPAANAKKASGAAVISNSASQLDDTPAPAPKKKAAAAIATATTGDDGTYKIENVPAGDYSIRVRSASGNGRTKDTVTVKAGETTTVPDIAVKPKKA
jgi:protocatechuate 3,4-dioxygenase beta subunit